MAKPTPWVVDVTVSKRRKISKGLREKIVLDNPMCYLCRVLFEDGDEIELDHVIALELGGLDDPSNIKPAHKRPCHVRKTQNDRRLIAKAHRLEAKRKGTAARKARKIPGRAFPKRKQEK